MPLLGFPDSYVPCDSPSLSQSEPPGHCSRLEPPRVCPSWDSTSTNNPGKPQKGGSARINKRAWSTTFSSGWGKMAKIGLFRAGDVSGVNHMWVVLKAEEFLGSHPHSRHIVPKLITTLQISPSCPHLHVLGWCHPENDVFGDCT